MPPSDVIDDAKARWLAGTEFLRQGRYREGFQLLEARHEVFQKKPRLPFPEWRGEKVRNLLVWPEQGFGDQIQMARFAKLLPRNTSWVCSAPLGRLFRQSLPVDVIETRPIIDFPDPDAWVMAFDLPRRLGVERPEDVPNEPYLWALSRRSRGIGFAWKGSPAHPNDQRRSLPSAALLEPLRAFGELIDLTEPFGDFLDTAEAVMSCRVIVTVDTALAHLAGALGKRCFVLLSEPADWRWMTGRSDSPWYPSVTLFRQPTPGDWETPLRAICEALRQSPPGPTQSPHRT